MTVAMTAAILTMILLPLVMAALLLWPALRPLILRGLVLAPLPGLFLLPAAWNGGETTLMLGGGWTFIVDQPAALMLTASVLLWMIAAVPARRLVAGRDGHGAFALWWLLTLAGSLGVFVAGDVVGFYALYALASLPAYGLITFAGGDEVRRAGRMTLAAALVGEGLILAGFVLLFHAAGGQGTAIATVMHDIQSSPHAGLVIALIVIGFGLKIGLVPLHGWMPASYAAGPLAAAAVLSGATSKAGIIGLIRFLPLDGAMPVAGGLIAALGLFSAFYGAAAGLTQANARSVLAYSSISQLGQMAAVLGAGLAAGAPGAATVVAYYAVYHVLTKGGLFLMMDSGFLRPGGHRWRLLFAGFVALGFAGLPLSGGALGKLAFKDVAGSGVTGLLLTLAAVASTVLMLHFLALVQRGETHAAEKPAAIVPWVAAAILATLLQWSLFAAVTGVAPAYALKPGVLLSLAWPVAAGALLFAALAWAGTQLPRLPAGDAGAAMMAAVDREAQRLARLALRLEGQARRWQVSSLCLALACILLVLLEAWSASR